jgi:hypothetical protein
MMRAERALTYIEYFLKRNPDCPCDFIYASGSALKGRIDTFLAAASEARDRSVTLDSPYYARLAVFAVWSAQLRGLKEHGNTKVREVFCYSESVYAAYRSLGDWRKPRHRLSVEHRARLRRAYGRMYREGHKL